MTGPCTETPIFDQLFTEVEPETQRLVLVAVADRPRPAGVIVGGMSFARYMRNLMANGATPDDFGLGQRGGVLS